MSQAQDVFETLRREHAVAGGLLGRMEELAERIQAGTPVSPTTVRRGVGLLDAYLHRVHVRQFDVDLWPEFLAAAHPECVGALRQIRAEHERMRLRAQELLGQSQRWASGDPGAAEEVARGLVRLVEHDTDVNRFEERHPFACLAAVLPKESLFQAGTVLDGHAGTKKALEANIGRFLGRTA